MSLLTKIFAKEIEGIVAELDVIPNQHRERHILVSVSDVDKKDSDYRFRGIYHSVPKNSLLPKYYGLEVGNRVKMLVTRSPEPTTDDKFPLILKIYKKL